MPLRWPLCHQADEAHLRVCVHIGCLEAALPYLFTWSLPLTIIDKYDDMILLYPAERARKLEGEQERGRESEGKRVRRK